jgi:leucyl aminopeptidase
MKYDVLTDEGKPFKTDLLVFISDPADKLKHQIEHSSLSPVLKSRLQHLVRVTRPDSEISDFLTDGDSYSVMFLLIAVNPEKNQGVEYYRNAGYKIVHAMRRIRGSRCIVLAPESCLSDPRNCNALIEGIEFSRYTFERFRTKKDPPFNFREINLLTGKKAPGAKIRRQINQRRMIMKAVNYARTLCDTPANHLTPKILADEVVTHFKEKKGFRVDILDEKKLRKLKMGAFLSIAGGSAEPPRLILIHYRSGRKNARTLGLAGKGITFDSGGISLKPHKGMEEMKYDMAGAAAVIGIMDTLPHIKPRFNVIAAIPAAENLPGGSAVKPGDVVTACNGKTIEIINTDAEGRLLLADVLAYLADVFKPDYMIDFATLTGSVVVALGSAAAGLFGNNQVLLKNIRHAAEESGESVWEMPMWDEYRRELRSEVADIKNVGGREAGSITAAKFLEFFVGDIPWSHLDIAGTAYGLKHRPYLGKGATGAGIRLTVELLRHLT